MALHDISSYMLIESSDSESEEQFLASVESLLYWVIRPHYARGPHSHQTQRIRMAFSRRSACAFHRGFDLSCPHSLAFVSLHGIQRLRRPHCFGSRRSGVRCHVTDSPTLPSSLTTLLSASDRSTAVLLYVLVYRRGLSRWIMMTVWPNHALRLMAAVSRRGGIGSLGEVCHDNS